MRNIMSINNMENNGNRHIDMNKNNNTGKIRNKIKNFIILIFALAITCTTASAQTALFNQGNDVLLSEKSDEVIPNQNAANSKGESTIDVQNNDASVQTKALSESEDSTDGQAKASDYVASVAFKLGNEVLMSKEENHVLIAGKRVGLVTNQSGVNSKGESTIDVLVKDSSLRLTALYGPEHGIDGQAKAGEYVESYVHPQLKIPVYSLYGATRMPSENMLKNVDVLVYDIQDIGARTYTYISTLNYCMQAAQKYGKTIIVLDRPNPLGGVIVEGPVLEERFKTFVGVDNLPMAHGMTVGELALYFNRNIGADLKVVKMEGYQRQMIYQDTGLSWTATSPNIPDLASVFGYMATGLGEGTGIFQADKFKWIGGNGINAQTFANLLNQAELPGVTFVPENKGKAGGVKLVINNYRLFNPAKTGIYALAYAHSLNHFAVPKSGNSIVMFDKIMGTDKFGLYLEQGLSPRQIVANYTPRLNSFKEERKKYLLYDKQNLSDHEQEPKDDQLQNDVGNSNRNGNGAVTVIVRGKTVAFDAEPYIDENNRLMVPLRAIGEALGAQVDWNPELRMINITGKMMGEGQKVVFIIGHQNAVVNGLNKLMDTCPVIKNSRTMVPARYIGEYLGAKVDWKAETRTVTVE